MKKLAIFDFDGTLFTIDTLPFLLRKWRKLGYPALPLWKATARIYGGYLVQKKGLFGYTNERFRADAMKYFILLFRRMKKEEINGFFREAAKDVSSYLHSAVVESLHSEKEAGKEVIVLSGGFQVLLEYGLKGLPVDYFMGTRIPYTSEGKVDYSRELRVITGSEKLARLLEEYGDENIDWQNSSGYGDSGSDLLLLEKVGSPVAVRPDEKLKERAGEGGWPVIE